MEDCSEHKGFSKQFFTCRHFKNNWNFLRKVYFSNYWALFVVCVWFSNHEAKTFWWDQHRLKQWLYWQFIFMSGWTLPKWETFYAFYDCKVIWATYIHDIFFLFQGYYDIRESPLKRMEIFIFDTHQWLSAIVALCKFRQHHSCEGCLFSSEKLVT